METWVQNYTAIGGSLYLTAAAALLPIVFFFAALTVLKLKGYQAGLYAADCACRCRIRLRDADGYGGFFPVAAAGLTQRPIRYTGLDRALQNRQIHPHRFGL